jgi:hypothetical protein
MNKSVPEETTTPGSAFSLQKMDEKEVAMNFYPPIVMTV